MLSMTRYGRALRPLIVVLFVAAVVVWARASGSTGDGPPLAGTQPADGRGDPTFPAFNNEGAPGTFLNPGRCQTCHSSYRAPGEKIYEPSNAWWGSMMANSARDPLFWAALDIANQDDRKRLGGVGIGDFCIRCHVPKGWYEGRSDCDTPYGERFDGACLQGSPTRRDSDFEGITCHVCHRAYDASRAPADEFYDPHAPYDGNAQLHLSRYFNQMRGPFSDSTSPGHETVGSELHKSSAFCGQCHNITNPVLHERDPRTGADLGHLFPIERTYREWQSSRFGVTNVTCQSCHMPQPDLDGDGTGDAGLACNSAPGPRGQQTALEGPLHTHFFRGGSSWMQSVLKGEYGNALRRNESFDAAIEASLQLLQSQTVSVKISLPAWAAPGGVARPVVRVTNRAGHKFPTGYAEGRRAWIHLQAGEDKDEDGTLDAGEVSFESAPYDPATAELTLDPQAKVYESKQGVWNYNQDGRCDIVDARTGREMFHFAINDCIVKDNRIPPQNFVPDAETKPVGYTYPGNPSAPGTLVHWDDTRYHVPIPRDATQQFLFAATVYYQSSSKEYIEFLRDENQSSCDPRDPGCDPTVPDDRLNRGEKMHLLWESYGRSLPVPLAQATKAIRLGKYIVPRPQVPVQPAITLRPTIALQTPH